MSKPAPFPHRYSVHLADRQLQALPRSPIAVGPPLQFGGTDRVWSPEELLVGAVVECWWTTFEAYARHKELAFDDLSANATGVLDKGPTGPAFTAIELTVELTVAAADEARARELIVTAEKHCIISNSLKAPVTIAATIRTR